MGNVLKEKEVVITFRKQVNKTLAFDVWKGWDYIDAIERSIPFCTNPGFSLARNTSTKEDTFYFGFDSNLLAN